MAANTYSKAKIVTVKPELTERGRGVLRKSLEAAIVGWTWGTVCDHSGHKKQR
jgi:hypothetical protein